MNCLFLLVLLFACNRCSRQDDCSCIWPRGREQEREGCGCDRRMEERSDCGCEGHNQEREGCGCERRMEERINCGRRNEERENCGCEGRGQEWEGRAGDRRSEERESCGCDRRSQERTMPRYDDMRSCSYADTVPEMNQQSGRTFQGYSEN